MVGIFNMATKKKKKSNDVTYLLKMEKSVCFSLFILPELFFSSSFQISAAFSLLSNC